MCGLFGFFGSTPNSTFDPDFLTRAALAAGQRGPESFGIYARFPDSSQKTIRYPQPLVESIKLLKVLDGALLVIGHARLATSGTSSVAVQPIVIEDRSTRTGNALVSLAHNGNIYNHRALADRLFLRPQTECDSELLALLIARGLAHGPYFAIRNAIDLIESAPLALLLFADSRFFVARSRLPVFYCNRPEGVYFCSVAFDATCEVLPDESLCHIGDFGAPLPSMSVMKLRRTSTIDSSPRPVPKEKNVPKETSWRQLPLQKDQS